MWSLNLFMVNIFIWPLDMKGRVLPAGQLRVLDARWFKFSHKTSNRSHKWTFGIGHWRMRIFILIKAPATIRNFMVVFIS